MNLTVLTPILRSLRKSAPACAAITLALCIQLVACSGGGGSTNVDTPPPPPPPPTTPMVGPAWLGFGGDAQHSAIGTVAAQSLTRLIWQMAVDLAPQYTNGALLVHYGSPVITAKNTVIVPVKTGATNGFRFDARSGANGTLLWSATTDCAFRRIRSMIPA